MKTIKFIATDMDGTLLDNNRKVSEESVRAIKEAQKAGITVVVATGRDYTEAITPLKEVGLRLPLICVNGADIREEDGNVIQQQSLSTDQFNVINRILQEEEIYFEITTSKGTYTNNEKRGLELVVDLLKTTGEFSSYEEAMALAEKRFEQGAVFRTDDYHEILRGEGTLLLKVLAFSTDREKRERAEAKLAQELNISVSASARDNLEITHQYATKGKGIEIMTKRFNLDVSEAMVVGDNFNDVSMMQIAGYAVAMGNAEKEIKQLCDFTTATNGEDGVAKAIRSVITHQLQD
ncbi:HAD family hydrolase [Salipaludibacillus agaradhaerens]|uniref:HAD family hydrolase n=1 Tax=Salipaludibacillus agaradhaerens TaxID=76935 RepID=UPI001FE5F70A|nr:HAD family hydrolase [Salipaludibacillus agaradhaerens]